MGVLVTAKSTVVDNALASGIGWALFGVGASIFGP
jgi:hypothetical protein